jgi:hypothetical protein
MEEKILQEVLETGNPGLIMFIVFIYLAFQVTLKIIEIKKSNKRSAKSQEILSAVKDMAESSKIKDDFIEAIRMKLNIISNQYGSQLSKDTAAVLINNIYVSFATMMSNEIYELKKLSKSTNVSIKHIRDKSLIFNQEKTSELGLFVYQNKTLSSFSNGVIIGSDTLVNIFNEYGEKNGMLRKEIENEALISAQKVIKKL